MMVDANIITKQCSKCGAHRPVSEFHRRKSASDGRASNCKPCRRQTCAAYRSANPGRVSAARKAWRDANADAQAALVKAWQIANKDRVKANNKAWQAANKERTAALAKAWAAANPGRVVANRAAWRNANKTREAEARKAWNTANSLRKAEINRAWSAANSDLRAAYAAARRAAKHRATPSWAIESEIVKFYEDAARLSRETGYAWHVDHIVPLRSRLVCGLHWEGNLRVITGHENQSKGAWYWPDMP